jgi:hypothetical protein
MSLCYEFDKWTMITFALVSATLVTGLITIGKVKENEMNSNSRLTVNDRLKEFKPLKSADYLPLSEMIHYDPQNQVRGCY